MPDFSSIIKQGSVGNYRDQLGQHIKNKALPLCFRPPTSTKGNCWYDGVADQVKVLGINGRPTTPGTMRKCVMEFLQKNQSLKKNCFNNNDHLLAAFVLTHSQEGVWTDNASVIQSATAMFLERNINIVGTSNTSGRGYTTVYGMGDADFQSPLWMGYYQNIHYQSLQQVKEIR